MHIIFDTETTGLYNSTLVPLNKLPHVIELYAMARDPETLEFIDEIDLLIKPPIQISAEITKITTITNEMLKDAPSFVEVADQIEAFFSRATKLVAHNLSYDLGVMGFEFQRLGRESPLLSAERCCTVEKTEHIKGHRMKLGDLHEYLFGETFKGAHRGKADVQALDRCYMELMKREEL